MVLEISPHAEHESPKEEFESIPRALEQNLFPNNKIIINSDVNK